MTVLLLGVPLALHARAQEHREAVMREFALLSVRPDVAETVPDRLSALMNRVQTAYRALAHDISGQRDAVLASGGNSLDVRLEFRADAAAISAELNLLLDELDRVCARELWLLTGPPEPAVVAFRRWYFTEITRQCAGSPPTAWPKNPDG